MNTEKCDFSLFIVILVHIYKTMITKAITSTCCRRHNTPKEYCNYKTNVHKSTSVEINSGCTGLLNSILESNAD